jgi:protein phosphatase 1L
LALFSVFDGHAGPRCSKFLKEHFARLVFDLKATRRGEIPIGLYKAFAKAESQYCTAAKTNGWNDGSTGVVAVVHGQQLIMAHVGDSRAVMCREKRAICLTSDHKPDREDEEKRIKQLGGTVERHEAGGSIARVNGHLAVSRAFGDLRMKETERFVSAEPEISVIPLTPQDKFVIIASDGLWDVLSNQEAVDAVRREPNKHKAAKNLVKRALKIGTTDNITVLIVWLTWVHNHPLPNTRGSGISLTSSASDAVTTTSDNSPEDEDNHE